MVILEADFKDWHIEYIPDDGARISCLRYNGNDLLTFQPFDFNPPVKFYGEYETRPVFGYDDCFPTVDACEYPGTKTGCRDHGEICWQKWKAEVSGNSITFFTNCIVPAVRFKRIMIFGTNILHWRFEVENMGNETSPFLHVMHALLPLRNISHFELPGCNEIFDEMTSEPSGLGSSSDVVKYLSGLPEGSFSMLLFRKVTEGLVKVGYNSGLALEIGFDNRLFPTLGIWWNNRGYPDGGQVRSECAFEPIPGTCSDLSKSFMDGAVLSAKPGEILTWDIYWTVH